MTNKEKIIQDYLKRTGVDPNHYTGSARYFRDKAIRDSDVSKRTRKYQLEWEENETKAKKRDADKLLKTIQKFREGNDYDPETERYSNLLDQYRNKYGTNINSPVSKADLNNFDKYMQYLKKEQEPKEQAKQEQPKKDDGNFFKDLFNTAKRGVQAINPFDDVSMKEALQGEINAKRSNDTEEVNRFATRTLDSATLGGLKALEKGATGDTSNRYDMRKLGEGGATDMVSSGIGYLIPGTGAAKLVRGTKLGANTTKGMSTLQKALQYGKEGAVTGLGLGLAETPAREYTNPEESSLARIALETAGGAVADPILHVVGSKLASFFGKNRVSKQEITQALSDPQVPEEIKLEIRKTIPQKVYEPTINEQQPFNVLNEPIKPQTSTEDVFANLRPQSTVKPNVNVDKAYYDEFGKALDEQVALLKSQMGKGVTQGHLIQDELGNVIDRVGRISNNPQWYQELYAQLGRQPNNEDLYNLAYKQLTEGYVDDGVQIPAWQPKQAQELTEEISQLEGMNEPSLQRTLEVLKQGREEVSKPRTSINIEPKTVEQPNLNELIQKLKNVKQKEKYENISQGKEGTNLARLDDTVEQFNSGGGNSDSFRAKVDRNPKKDGKFKDFFTKLRTNFVDDLAPLEKLERSQNKGKLKSAENSVYKQARLFRGVPEKANQFVQDKLAPIMSKIESKGYTYEDLGDYALAVHAKDVNEAGMKSGFTNSEIQDVLHRLGSKDMEEARRQLVQVSDELLNVLVKSGNLSKEGLQAMREKWPNYMPLFRSFDDAKVEFGGGLSQSLANATNPIKRLQGSERNVIDPIESMVKNVFKTFNEAGRNNVAKRLAKLEDGEIIRRVDPKEDVKRLNVVSVMENGEKVKYEVPPDIYETMVGLDKVTNDAIINILKKPAETLRAGATLTPEFSLRNPMRDVLQAYVVSSSKFNPIIDFPIGLLESIFKGRKIKVGNKEFNTPGKWYRQFIEDNAGYGNIISMDRNVHRKALEKVLKEGDTKKFVNIVNPVKWKEFLQTLADISESATKVGEYRAAIKKAGVSRDEAAYRARDIMDFARSGKSIRNWNKVVAFLNANIQGKSKLWRAFQENPKQTSWRAFKAVTLPTVGFYVMQQTMSNEQQKKTIDDAPEWLKQTFWLVPIPGTNQVARIPKPFDLAPLFATPIEKGLDYFKENDKEAFDGYVKELMSNMAVPTMLTGITPIIEGMANYSFFRQGPIIPRREDDINYPDQYDINTSESAKLLGKGINKLTGGEGPFKNFGSPRVVDNTIRGITGGLGQYATSAIDFIVEDVGDFVKDPEKPDKQINQQPLLRSFLVNQSSTGASVDKLYNLLEKMKRERGSAREKTGAYKKEAKFDYVSDTTKKISEISKQMRSIENSKDMNGAEKRKELDKLNELRNEIARTAVQKLKEVK